MRIKAAGLCHSDLSVINGDRPRPLPMALGPRGRRHRRGGRPRGGRSADLGPRRSRGVRVRALLRPLRAVRRGPAGLVRAGCGGERGRHAALGRAPAAPGRRHGRAASSGRVGLRRVRHGLAPLAGQDRPGAAARRGGAVRLRRAHRRRCGGQHRAGAGRRLGGGDRPGRRRPVLAAGRDRRRRARDRRHRPGRRQAGLRPRARRHRHLQRQGPGLRRAGQERHRRRGRVRVRAGRLGRGPSSSPTRSPGAAAPR